MIRLRRLHTAAGMVAMATILAFWLSTVLTELFGSHHQVVLVKTAIPWGLFLLVPALAATGGSGFRLSRGAAHPLVAIKLRRMRIIAGLGIGILVPAALFLAWRAGGTPPGAGFGGSFYAVQALELVAGAINLALLGLNARDGLALTGRRAPLHGPV